MRSLQNMGLWMWDQSGDPYNHEQLASNFARLDSHDHTNGRGVQLTTESIAPGSIDNTLLGSEAVALSNLTAELQAKLVGEITTAGIANGAVTEPKLAANSVVTSKIGTEQVTEAKLDAPTKGKLTEATTAKSELTGLKAIALTTTSMGSAYTTSTYTTSGKEEEPSATRPTLVTLTAVNPFEVFVGAVKIANIGQGTVTFECPPGKKWKATGSGVTTSPGLAVCYLVK